MNWNIRTRPKTTRPRVRSGSFTVISNEPVGDRYFQLTLHAPEIAASSMPGQFLMISPALPGQTMPTLPRPMAIFDLDPATGIVTVIYGVLGKGTQKLSEATSGQQIVIVGPLGQPFELQEDSESVLIIGRGIGICSVGLLAKQAKDKGLITTVVTSGRNTGAMVGSDFFDRLNLNEHIKVIDEDQSSSVANLTAMLKKKFFAPPDQIFICGSDRLATMSRELAQYWDADVQISVEAHMACGIGYCHGCASGKVGATEESPLVCFDGPVFNLV